MVNANKPNSVTKEQVEEIVDNKKDPRSVTVLLWLFRGALFLTLWKSAEKIYVIGINESTIAGVGLGASTIIVLWLIANVFNSWFPKFLKRWEDNK